MHPLLTATASRQAGLITRRQAVKAGLTERQLRTLTAVHGPWVTVRRGVYCDRDVWLAAGERFHGQALLKDRAADLIIRVPHLLSHDSAARALDIPFLNPELELTHITREGVGGTRTEQREPSDDRQPRSAHSDSFPRAGRCRRSSDLMRIVTFSATGLRSTVGSGSRVRTIEPEVDRPSDTPTLREAEVTREEAAPLCDRIPRNVELFLACDRIHGDLSAYNILHRAGGATIIDFAQAVDARSPGDVYTLLARDVERVCRFFARLGVESDPAALAGELWERYLRGEL